jgi:TRAP transporter TAXI family solute receptor
VIRAAAVLAIGVVAGSCAAPEPSAPAGRRIRLMTGLIGSGYDGLGHVIADSYVKTHPTTKVDVIEGTGSVSTVEAIQAGQVDIGIALADVAYLAFAGRLGDRQTHYDRIRGLSVLQLTPLQLVVRTNAPIRAVPDLKGRSVVVGPTGSGTPFTVALVLRAFGVSSGAVRTVALPFKEGTNLLRTGEVDAMFLNATYPAQNVREAIAAGAHLVSIDRRDGKVTRDEWENSRRQRIGAPKSITITVDSPNVSVVADDLVNVTFRQGYRSDIVTSSATTKVLVMVKTDGRWLIQQESAGN